MFEWFKKLFKKSDDDKAQSMQDQPMADMPEQGESGQDSQEESDSSMEEPGEDTE